VQRIGKMMIHNNPKLADVSTPNLYREAFPYTEFPKVIFDNKSVPYEIPEKIWVTDTTFRDGQQARHPYTPQQVLRIYDFLHEIDGGTGLIRQCEFFLYSDRDRKAVELCKERGYRYPEITGWIRAVAADFKLVSEMGLQETGILTSASDYHIFLKLRKTRDQAMNAYLDIAKAALDTGVIPRCHFEDVTRADYDGFVLPFSAELMKLAKEYNKPVKIRLCDTLGFGLPWDGVALPRSIPRLIHGLRKIGVPAEWLEWHGHNDLHKVQVNAATLVPGYDVARLRGRAAHQVSRRIVEEDAIISISQGDRARNLYANEVSLDSITRTVQQIQANISVPRDEVALRGVGPANLVAGRTVEPNALKRIPPGDSPRRVGPDEVGLNHIASRTLY